MKIEEWNIWWIWKNFFLSEDKVKVKIEVARWKEDLLESEELHWTNNEDRTDTLETSWWMSKINPFLIMFYLSVSAACNPAVNLWTIQDFPDGGRQPPQIWRFLRKTAWKWKEIRPRGDVSPMICLGSANVENTSGCWRRGGVMEVIWGSFTRLIYVFCDPLTFTFFRFVVQHSNVSYW